MIASATIVKKDLFEDSLEFDLLRINGKYWALKDKDSDNQLILESNMSYINIPYTVDLVGTVKVPITYFEMYAEDVKCQD